MLSEAFDRLDWAIIAVVFCGGYAVGHEIAIHCLVLRGLLGG